MATSRRRCYLLAFAIALFAFLSAFQMAPHSAWAIEGELVAADQQSTPLTAQSIPDPYETPDGLVVINGATEGDVSYNNATKTLTLDNVQATSLLIRQGYTLTLELVGASSVGIVNDDSDSEASLTIAGDGSLDAVVHVKGDLVVERGTLNSVDGDFGHKCGISCAGFVMKSGRVTARGESDDSSYGIECSSFDMLGGTLEATGAANDSWRYGIFCKGDFIMWGGELKATAESYEEGTSSEWGQSGYGIECTAFVLKGGKLTVTGKGFLDTAVGIDCERANIYGGELRSNGFCEGGDGYGIRCSSVFLMSDGNVEARGDAGGYDAVVGGGMGVSCSKFRLLGGELTAWGAGLANSKNKEGGFGKGVFCSSYMMTAGTLNAEGTGEGYADCRGIDCKGAFSQRGGFLTAYGNNTSLKGAAYGVYCDVFEVESTNNGVSNVKGRAKSSYGIYCNSSTISGGKTKVTAVGSGKKAPEASYGMYCAGIVTLKKGNVTVSKVASVSGNSGNKAVSCGKLSVKGGALQVLNCNGAGVDCKSLVMTKGSIAVKGQKGGNGINMKGGNLKVSGGTLSVTKSSANAVMVKHAKKGKGTVGGKVVITGGKVTAQTTKPATKYAIGADSLSYKAQYIKSVKGAMPAGFAFKYKGNSYKCLGNDLVKLVKYGAGKVNYKTVAYGGHKYTVK